MRGILADINIGKQRRAILAIWATETWRDLWNALALSVASFPSLGLSYDASDALIWETCQREGLVLITGNRNKRGPDSLEAVIQRENLRGKPAGHHDRRSPAGFERPPLCRASRREVARKADRNR